jgi:aconitate hydratase
MKDTFSVRDTLEVNGQRHAFASLTKLGEHFDLKRLPYSLKILLENLLRHEDGVDVTSKEIEAIAKWDAKAEPATEIAGTRGAAGLHRRALRGRPGCDA